MFSFSLKFFTISCVSKCKRALRLNIIRGQFSFKYSTSLSIPSSPEERSFSIDLPRNQQCMINTSSFHYTVVREKEITNEGRWCQILKRKGDSYQGNQEVFFKNSINLWYSTVILSICHDSCALHLWQEGQPPPTHHLPQILELIRKLKSSTILHHEVNLENDT